MQISTLKTTVQQIVAQATELKNKHTDATEAPVNYACIFSQNPDEYSEFVGATKNIGKVIRETPNGLLFHIEPLETISGRLRLLKIRTPDPTRPERGDADFTVSDFQDFKDKYLEKNGFKMIKKDNFLMIELMERGSDVRVYFSYPPLDKQLGIK